PDAVYVELYHDAMDVFVAAARASEGLDALRAGPLIYAGRVHQCRVLLEQLAERQLVPERLLACGDLEQVKALALAGVGVALLPRRVAAYEQEGRLVRLDPALPHFPDTISLVYRADLHRTRAARLLKDALVRYGRLLDEK